MYDTISEKEIKKHLTNPFLPIYTFKSIDSTNSFAKKLDESTALVVSEGQSAGRGRLGRNFFSPDGTGIYMSLKVNIPSLYDNVPFITTLSAVSVHKAIKKLYNIDCGIKWVNDIYIKHKKVSGILCEIVDNTHTVIGIGINVYPTSFPDDIKEIATHLPENKNVSRCMLIAEITNNLFSLISKLPSSDFMEYYKSHSILIGKQVICTQGNLSFSAFCTDISPTGGLVVKKGDEVITLTSGEVTVRFKD